MRNSAIDGLRVLAIVAVIVIHVSGVAPDAMRPALFDFLVGASDWCVSALFLVSGYVTAARGHTWDNVSRWLVRLMVPYALWTVVYGVALRVVGNPEPLSVLGWARLLLFGGAAAHLWFLPALMACHLIGLSFRRTWVMWAVLAATIPLAVLRAAGPDMVPFAYEWVRYAAPGWICVYTGGVLLRRLGPMRISPVVIRVASVLLPAIGGAAFLFRDEAALAWGVMVLSGTVLAFLLASDAASERDTLGLSRLSALSAYALGMYLFHMVPIYAAKGILGSGAVQGGLGLGLLLLVTLMSSWLFAVGAARTPFRRLIE